MSEDVKAEVKTETISVEISGVDKWRKELSEIKDSLSKHESEERTARQKARQFEQSSTDPDNFFPSRRNNNYSRPGKFDGPRGGGRGRDDNRPRGRGGRRSRSRDRNRRDNYGRRDDRRRGRGRDDQEEQAFYGLASSGGRNSNRDDGGLSYKSQYADADDISSDEEEVQPKMTSLVEKDSGSESESEPGKIKEEPSRKRGREENSREDRKRRRVNILSSMKTDKKNATRSKRLFGFMMNHLGRARKEAKKKTDVQSTFAKKAKSLKEEQKKEITKDYKQKQIEKYKARAEYQKAKKEVQLWRKRHVMNLLKVDSMKTQLKVRFDLIDTGFLLTSKDVPITWKPAEIDPVKFDVMKEKAKENLQVRLDMEIQQILDDEGEQPEDPAPLPRKFEVSPVRHIIRPDNDEDDKGVRSFGGPGRRNDRDRNDRDRNQRPRGGRDGGRGRRSRSRERPSGRNISTKSRRDRGSGRETFPPPARKRSRERKPSSRMMSLVTRDED